MDKALIDRIEANKAEYERLLKDECYIDVRFNPKNGALSEASSTWHKQKYLNISSGKMYFAKSKDGKVVSI